MQIPHCRATLSFRTKLVNWAQPFSFCIFCCPIKQELPASDEFGCSQASQAPAQQVAAAQEERDVKRRRPDQAAGGAGALFGDGIDELMDGLGDELEF